MHMDIFQRQRGTRGLCFLRKCVRYRDINPNRSSLPIVSPVVRGEAEPCPFLVDVSVNKLAVVFPLHQPLPSSLSHIMLSMCCLGLLSVVSLNFFSKNSLKTLRHYISGGRGIRTADRVDIAGSISIFSERSNLNRAPDF